MKKPQIRYEWRRQVHSIDANSHDYPWRVCWSLYGANGEFMCGDGGQGYQDKHHARVAVNSVALRLGSWGIDDPDTAKHLREVGPGRKPK